LHGITATALELLETLSPLDKAARECCQLIAECGRLMRSLIEDILDFDQIESNRLLLDKLPFDVVHEVERAVRVLAGAAAKKKIELDTSTADVAHPSHVGDPLRFRQIVFNLLSNAIKFTPDGGRIRVSVANSDANPEEVNVEVADNGIGIGPDHLPQLFIVRSHLDLSIKAPITDHLPFCHWSEITAGLLAGGQLGAKAQRRHWPRAGHQQEPVRGHGRQHRLPLGSRQGLDLPLHRRAARG
jgi:light-regulated signal transduction histidine kinase (bacteriophytochrome)